MRTVPEHGTNTRYSRDGCRCDPCRADATEARKERRQRQVSGTAARERREMTLTQKKLDDLLERGWSLNALHRRTGVHLSTLSKLRNGKTKRHHPRLIDAINELFWSGEQPPPRIPSTPLEELHGTTSGYRRGFRCDDCRAAVAAAKKLRRAQRRGTD